jgi:hypothetical protein
VLESPLVGQSRLSESLKLYHILHPSAEISHSGTGSRRWRQILRGGGGFNVANCF